MPRRAATKTAPPADPYLTIEQVCTILGVARSTFDAYRAAGEAPEVLTLPGGGLRILESTFAAWCAARTKAA